MARTTTKRRPVKVEEGKAESPKDRDPKEVEIEQLRQAFIQLQQRNQQLTMMVGNYAVEVDSLRGMIQQMQAQVQQKS